MQKSNASTASDRNDKVESMNNNKTTEFDDKKC